VGGGGGAIGMLCKRIGRYMYRVGYCIIMQLSAKLHPALERMRSTGIICIVYVCMHVPVECLFANTIVFSVLRVRIGISRLRSAGSGSESDTVLINPDPDPDFSKV
jgi:hypothetical protein